MNLIELIKNHHEIPNFDKDGKPINYRVIKHKNNYDPHTGEQIGQTLWIHTATAFGDCFRVKVSSDYEVVVHEEHLCYDGDDPRNPFAGIMYRNKPTLHEFVHGTEKKEAPNYFKIPIWHLPVACFVSSVLPFPVTTLLFVGYLAFHFKSHGL